MGSATLRQTVVSKHSLLENYLILNSKKNVLPPGFPRWRVERPSSPMLDRKLPQPFGRVEILAQTGRVWHPQKQAGPQLQTTGPGDDQLIVWVVYHWKMFEGLMLFYVLCHCNVNVFRFWTVGRTKHGIFTTSCLAVLSRVFTVSILQSKESVGK